MLFFICGFVVFFSSFGAKSPVKLYTELQQALSQMGYNLSPQFTQLLVTRYCPRSASPAMQLDRFIQVCTQLQVLTEAFREKDTAVQGNIRLSFEDFVTMTASRML